MVYDGIPAVSDLGQKIVKHIATLKETTYLDTKSRHLKKLQNLEDKTAEEKEVRWFWHRFIRHATEKNRW